MTKPIRNVLDSGNVSDRVTRVDLTDGRSIEGIITVYDEETGCVRLMDREDLICFDLPLDEIRDLSVVDYRDLEWSL